MTAVNTAVPLWSDDTGLLVYDPTAAVVSYRTACCHCPASTCESSDPVCSLCQATVPRRVLTVWTREQFLADTDVCGQCGARLADCPASPLNG